MKLIVRRGHFKALAFVVICYLEMPRQCPKNILGNKKGLG